MKMCVQHYEGRVALEQVCHRSLEWRHGACQSEEVHQAVTVVTIIATELLFQFVKDQNLIFSILPQRCTASRPWRPRHEFFLVKTVVSVVWQHRFNFQICLLYQENEVRSWKRTLMAELVTCCEDRMSWYWDCEWCKMIPVRLHRTTFKAFLRLLCVRNQE